jgi:hypothetical protein
VWKKRLSQKSITKEEMCGKKDLAKNQSLKKKCVEKKT